MTEHIRSFDAWWLPGFEPTPTTSWYKLEGDGFVARAPRLEINDFEALLARLRRSRNDYLRLLPVDQIVQRIGAAINRWLDPFSSHLHQACRLIPAFTGYPEEAVRKGLAGYLASFRDDNLRRLLREELGDPEVLDGFRPRLAAPGLTRATGPELVTHNFAGNVPGLPAQSLVAATLTKAASLGKVASDEPIFASLFARSLADVDPRLASCLAVTYWPGEDVGPADIAFGAADLVVAYGSDAAIDAVRARVPAGRRVIAYGHKLSFGLIARERLTPDALPDLAERAAYDVARFDQQGCLSPHLFYVEDGGEVTGDQFARALAGALQRWSAVVPRGSLTADERARVADVRRQHEFRAATTGGAVHGTVGDDWCVLVDPDPTFAASCLNRTVWIKPIVDASALPEVLAPVQRYLQTAAVSADAERLIEIASALADLGLDRVCPLGQMGDPPVTWHHDGRFNLLDFVRFTDLEPESAAGRWEFSHPDRGVLGIERREMAQGV
jgi:hypothetical protein